jgi:hypothetical protein
MRTKVELRQLVRRYNNWATDAERFVCLNPRHAETWRKEAAKLRALAAAAEVDLQIAIHGREAA